MTTIGIHEKTPVPAKLKKRNTVPDKAKAIAKSTTASEVKRPRPKPRPLHRTYAVGNIVDEAHASHGGGESGDETDQINQHRKRQKVIDHGSPAELMGGDRGDDSNAESDSGPPLKKTKVEVEKKAKKKKESIRDAIEAAQGNTTDNVSRKYPNHVDNTTIRWKGKGKPKVTGSNQMTDERGLRWEKAGTR